MSYAIEITQQIFDSKGGEFITPPLAIHEKLKNIKALIFDWDGVFNGGEKGGDSFSGFSEIDAMGINMLRFSIWMNQNQKLPKILIITGAKNKAAVDFSRREHFDSLYFQCIDKTKALTHFLDKSGLKPSEIAFFYDDILDLPIAQKSGLNIFIKSEAKVAFSVYVKENKLADYITAFNGKNNGLREASEMLINLNQNFNDCIAERIAFSKRYQTYLAARNSNQTDLFTINSLGEIAKT